MTKEPRQCKCGRIEGDIAVTRNGNIEVKFYMTQYRDRHGVKHYVPRRKCNICYMNDQKEYMVDKKAFHAAKVAEWREKKKGKGTI